MTAAFTGGQASSAPPFTSRSATAATGKNAKHPPRRMLVAARFRITQGQPLRQDPTECCAMRARKVITRSGRGIRGKFPSKKMDKVVHWESLLERDAIMLFEMHPLVISYQEQPSEEIYYDRSGQAKSCYPDFLLRLAHGGQILIEIKRNVDLDRPSVAEKLGLIALRFAEQERPYRILSETQIRREPLRTNLHHLWEASRVACIGLEAAQAIDALGTTQQFTLNELMAVVGGKPLILAGIADGRLRTDLEKPLGPDSLIWSSKNWEAGDGAFQL